MGGHHAMVGEAPFRNAASVAESKERRVANLAQAGGRQRRDNAAQPVFRDRLHVIEVDGTDLGATVTSPR